MNENEKFAHSLATRYINGLEDYERVNDWIEGSRLVKVMDALERSSLSKKPGRFLKRLTPLLSPQFQRSKVDLWTRQHKEVSAVGLASSAENRVFHLPDDTRPLYSDRAAFMTDLILAHNCEKYAGVVMTRSSISHHAIARMAEHGTYGATSFSEHIEFTLKYCGTIAQRTHESTFDNPTMKSYMIPFVGGALVAVFMEMDSAQVRKVQKGLRVLSVRNWLDESKLSNMNIVRMGGGLNEFSNVMKRGDAANERFLRWIEGNARPWQFSDPTIGDQEYGEI